MQRSPQPQFRCSLCYNDSISQLKFDSMGEPLELIDPQKIIHNNCDCFMIVMRRHCDKASRAKKLHRLRWYYVTFTVSPKKYPTPVLREEYIRNLWTRLYKSKELDLNEDNSASCLEHITSNPHIHLLLRTTKYIRVSKLLRMNKLQRTELKSPRTIVDAKCVLNYIIKVEPDKSMAYPTNLPQELLKHEKEFMTY